MPSNGYSRPVVRLYPSGATEVTELSNAQRRLLIARHSPCQATTSSLINEHNDKEDEGFHTPDSACDCTGFKPPNSVKVKLSTVQPDSHGDKGSWGWEVCKCGHSLDVHGLIQEGHTEKQELIRRAKVALRIDELLGDLHKLLDFDYEDEDTSSLKRQLAPIDPSASTSAPMRPDLDSLKRARSPGDSTSLSSAAPSREGSVSVDSPRAKRRRLRSQSVTGSRPGTPLKGERHGHGKMPAQSQKGLPADGDGAAPSDVPKNDMNGSNGDDAGKPRRQVDQDDADLDRVAKGISVDTGTQNPTAAITSSDAAAAADDDDSATAPPPRRERPAVIEERSGLIQFRVVTNDGAPESMIILTGLKNIFQRQLPKMPREYITRLVMDRNHMSMAIVKRGLQVVGGITYRPFNHRKFAEIVFCAITSTEQVKGYGSHLMNHLKDHVKSSSDVMHFLTYADNYAIGYFKKQGFSKEISLDRSVWVGYIKDYEGGTLMQCSMVPRVHYLQVQDLLAAQKQAILTKIRSISKSHVVHPGLDVFRKGGENGVDRVGTPKKEYDSEDAAAAAANFKIHPSQVPGLKESAWTIEMDELARRPKRGPHHNLMRHVLVELSNHQAAWPFANPVNAQDVPDYYEFIKEPMDLSTMETKLEKNQYASLDDLLHDAYLIFNNCRLYNPPTSVYAKSANRLEKFVKDSLSAWKQQAGIL